MWADGREGEYKVVEPRGYDSGGLKKDGDEPGGSGGIHGGTTVQTSLLDSREGN